jgi:hypothetical protein
MRLDRPKEEIERELLERARETWGEGRAEALRAQIRDAAGWMATLGEHRLGIHDEEPDFLVASERREGRS